MTRAGDPIRLVIADERGFEEVGLAIGERAVDRERHAGERGPHG